MSDLSMKLQVAKRLIRARMLYRPEWTADDIGPAFGEVHRVSLTRAKPTLIEKTLPIGSGPSNDSKR